MTEQKLSSSDLCTQETMSTMNDVALRDRLRGMRPVDRPRLHIFGHEHDARGVVFDQELGMVFVNAVAVSGDQAVIDHGGSYVMKEGFRPLVVDIRPGGRRHRGGQ